MLVHAAQQVEISVPDPPPAGGDTWRVVDPRRQAVPNSIYGFAFDPAAPSRVFVAAAKWHDWPNWWYANPLAGVLPELGAGLCLGMEWQWAALSGKLDAGQGACAGSPALRAATAGIAR